MSGMSGIGSGNVLSQITEIQLAYIILAYRFSSIMKQKPLDYYRETQRIHSHLL